MRSFDTDLNSFIIPISNYSTYRAGMHNAAELAENDVLAKVFVNALTTVITFAFS